eukprot:GHRR01016833.1.p1 GENE.GHRR01016833.1~~GHRR01016833.1.p1  ORF type:complete len:222 (+),score=51.89 GHRR01016833.1:36-668(+)
MASGDTAAHKLFIRAAAQANASDAPTNVTGCPVSHAQGSATACPAASAEHGARINMPVVDNTAITSQQARLDTTRQRSSIPIATDQRPQHQEPGTDVWMYPSEQQFYNAMQRKGWDPSEKDMNRVVAIHNTVNERAWQHVLAWEMLHACKCTTPQLKRFQGKPNEYSPKARLLNLLVSAAVAWQYCWQTCIVLQSCNFGRHVQCARSCTC